MKPQYLTELFDDDERTTIPGGYEVPKLAKNPLAAQFEVPPRETVIGDLLAAYPAFEYEQVAHMVAAIYGDFDLDEIEYIDRIKNEATTVSSALLN